MCAVAHRVEPYQLALLIKKSLDKVYITSIKKIISHLSMLYLQKVLLIDLKKCVFYIIILCRIHIS